MSKLSQYEQTIYSTAAYWKIRIQMTLYTAQSHPKCTDPRVTEFLNCGFSAEVKNSLSEWTI